MYSYSIYKLFIWMSYTNRLRTKYNITYYILDCNVVNGNRRFDFCSNIYIYEL